MTKRSEISASRLLLENPYAYLEQICEPPTPDVSAIDVLRAARLSLGNQYAYMDEVAARREPPARASDSEHAWTLDAIAQAVRDVQRRLWREREHLWRDDAPISPVTMLDPAKVCELFSYDFEVVDSLGLYSDRSERIAVAGQIDRQERIVRISRDFDPEIQLFTAAHEIGHLILHPHIDRLHRDRALNGLAMSRDRIEFEADKFAVLFLLPEKLVRDEFEHRFLAFEFLPTEEALFALGRGTRNEVARNSGHRRRLARCLASALNYNGRNFHSLASHFGVTTETMAIRLEELRIVR